MEDIVFGMLGIAALTGIAALFSNNLKSVDWKQIFLALLMQILLAVFILLTPFGVKIFSGFGNFFVKIISFTNQGAEFVLGVLANQKVLNEIFTDVNKDRNIGFLFAFQVLPIIIFFSSLMAILYHIGFMQKIVQLMAWLMVKILKISGAESIAVAANIFIGQTEAPLVIRPYIESMTKSELFTLMVGGMATIAGSVLAAYVGVLGGANPDQQLYYATHLLSASIMAAPATIAISKILIPETQQSLTFGKVQIPPKKTSVNIIDAAAKGAADGMQLALNVAGMLLAFIALIAMLNWIISGFFTDLMGLKLNGHSISLELLLGYALSPIAWLIGVPWTDAVFVGSLIGQKIIINEFVAYLHLSQMLHDEILAEKSILISTYALCGFANIASIAIQIGGIGGIAPNRRSDLAKLGLLSVLGGSLATLMTATIAGVLTSL